MQNSQIINSEQTMKNFKLLAKVENLPLRFKHCGFSNYEVEETNRRQFDKCKNYNGKESLVLTGKTGTGKTHLSIAILKNFPMQDATEHEQIYAKTRYLTQLDAYQSPTYYPDLTDEERELKVKQVEEYLESEAYKYRPAKCLFLPIIDVFLNLNAASLEEKKNVLNQYTTSTYDCICFDDLGAERLTDASRQNLYYIIDRRYRDMLPTVITSNFTIREINEIEPRIASRLAEMGQILEFNGKDHRKQR